MNTSRGSQVQIIVFFLVLLIVLGLVGIWVIRPPGDNTDSNGSDSGEAVAVLVIDAFEPLAGNPETVIGEQSDSNCIVDPSGQGGWISGAGGWISGAGGWISGAGGWISGAGGWISGASQQPILDPHGRIVYNELEALIRQGGGVLEEFHIGSDLADTATPDTDWLRDVGRWSFNEGEGDIWLVAVDTDQYTSSVIGTRIQDAVELLDRQFRVTKFVLNMSFAIVPCDDVLTLEDYEDTLNEPEFDAFHDELIAAFTALGETANGTPLPEEVVEFLDSPRAEAFRQRLVERQRNQFTNCYPVSIDGVSQGSSDTPGQQPNQDGNVGTTGLPVTTICDDVQPQNDPMGQVITRLQNAELQNGTISIIPIAASGNRGDAFSFAPGFWPEVVSVSAFYNDPELCAGFEIPPSNRGEVQMYGMYDCLPGTSFAAPRLSLEAGVYLLRGGQVLCTDGAEARSSPPLAYLLGEDANGDPTFEYLFNNLERVEAARLYCEDFNTKVGVPPP
jgi:hypothetical protein